MANRVRIAIGSDPRDVVLVEEMAAGFARERGLAGEDRDRLVEVVGALCRWVIETAYPHEQAGELALQLELAEGAVRVLVEDWGEPITAFGGGLGEVPESLRALEAMTTDLRLVNLGREGKRLSAAVAAAGAEPEEYTHLSDFVRESPAAEVTADQVEVRDAGPADVEAISRLLYVNYGLGYGHPDFYRPEWVAGQMEQGRLVSTVATIGGEVVGHHAMMLEHEDGAGETGVAVVHPAYRGLGIFSRLFARTVERAQAAGVPAVFGRAVTSHPYSQRAEHSRGYRESALMLGSVPPGEPEGDEPVRRGASLLTFLPLTREGRPVSFPERYGSLLTEAYANLELGVTAPDAGRAQAELGAVPAVGCERDAERQTSLFTVSSWGEEGRDELLDALREAVRHHDDVAYCDLDLHALDSGELDEAVELLRNYDFFYAGLMLAGRAGHDHLRMQAMLTDNVELDHIVLDSDYAKGLREAIFADRGWLESHSPPPDPGGEA